MVLNKRENKENKYIRINREQYKTNFKNITDYLQKKPAVALKHNGYGLGILEIAKALDEVFCETYFVNFLEEAILLKENLKNVKNIITLEFTNKEDLFLYEKENIIFSISSAEELNLLEKYLTKKHKINLYFDTGMSGKGFLWTEAEEIFNKTKHLNIYSLLSHLSSAWKENGEQNLKQKNRFNQIREIFNKKEKRPLYSLCNTDGSRLGEEYTLDMVRVGRGIHGLSYYENVFNIRPAFQIIGRVIQSKILPNHSKSGYGALVNITNNHNTVIVDRGAFYINRINFLFTNKVRWFHHETKEYKDFNVLNVALGYSIVDFENYQPNVLDEVEFLFISRFNNP